jgi:hypothetical protein
VWAGCGSNVAPTLRCSHVLKTRCVRGARYCARPPPSPCRPPSAAPQTRVAPHTFFLTAHSPLLLKARRSTRPWVIVRRRDQDRRKVARKQSKARSKATVQAKQVVLSYLRGIDVDHRERFAQAAPDACLDLAASSFPIRNRSCPRKARDGVGGHYRLGLRRGAAWMGNTRHSASTRLVHYDCKALDSTWMGHPCVAGDYLLFLRHVPGSSEIGQRAARRSIARTIRSDSRMVRGTRDGPTPILRIRASMELRVSPHPRRIQASQTAKRFRVSNASPHTREDPILN